MSANKVWENRLRRKAKRLGWVLRKSRARSVKLTDCGGYRLTDRNGRICHGARFELTLREVQDHLDEHERWLRRQRRTYG